MALEVEYEITLFPPESQWEGDTLWLWRTKGKVSGRYKSGSAIDRDNAIEAAEEAAEVLSNIEVYTYTARRPDLSRSIKTST